MFMPYLKRYFIAELVGSDGMMWQEGMFSDTTSTIITSSEGTRGNKGISIKVNNFHDVYYPYLKTLTPTFRWPVFVNENG